MREKAVLILVGLALGLVAGYAIGLKVIKGYTVQETYKPAVRQSDDSLILERKPDATAKPKQAVPAGAKVDRIVQVEVETLEPIKRVGVDLTILSLPDGSKRVVASSPDGRVIGGSDIPVGPVLKPLKWSAGALYSPTERKYGGFIQYGNGPYVAHIGVVGNNMVVGLGVRF